MSHKDSMFDQIYAVYLAHKKECTMPYDPYRTPRQCPECGRLIDEVAKAIVQDEKEATNE